MKAADEPPTEFLPQVTATCKTGVMNIKVAFNNSYAGAIHARDFRTPQCMQFGDGSNTVSLSLNLLAKKGHTEYCGIEIHNTSGEVRFCSFFFLYIFYVYFFLSLQRFNDTYFQPYSIQHINYAIINNHLVDVGAVAH